ADAPPSTARPPLSYTTLFRSTGDAPDRRVLAVMLPGQVAGRGRDQTPELLIVQVAGDAEAVVALLGGERHQEEHAEEQSPRPARDRKSTRLNSSHEWISYAVF